jgi:hypothetical protein
MSDALDRYVYDDQVSRLQAEVDRLTMEREENREAIGELETELRSLRPSPGGMR